MTVAKMYSQFLLSIIFVIMTLDLWLWTQAELFTAISDLEPLLYTHRRTIVDLDDYISKEEKRLAVLKKHLNLYRNEHILAMDDVSYYLGNPINAFTLIKRLTKDLDFIEKNLIVGTNYVKNTTINHADVLYPTLEDLTGSVLALTRLQDTYRLHVGELSEGRLNGVISKGAKQPATSTPLTTSDCYEIGRTLYNEKDYRNSLRWMIESLRKFNSGDDLYNVAEVDILEYISFTHYLLGDIQTALEWTKKILLLDPVHSNALNNVEYFQKALEEREELNRRGEVFTVDEHSSSTDLLDEDTKRTYEALCRGDIEVSNEIQKKLKCSYLTENHPFLKLAPIKMEKMYDDPEVIVFHQVISDEEIEHIKNQAKSKLTRAGVNDPATGQAIAAPYRISKTAWLHDDLSPVVARVSQRVSDFTGLTMSTAEELQVVNYGIGGHYVAHLDYYRDADSTFQPPSGQRIATVLFYMSEVAQGGATVFTDLGLSVFPIKNAALFWMNVLPSGEGNERTRHAACPVLRGSKWASNKWIHQIGQELLKPCKLVSSEKTNVRTKHKQ